MFEKLKGLFKKKPIKSNRPKWFINNLEVFVLRDGKYITGLEDFMITNNITNELENK